MPAQIAIIHHIALEYSADAEFTGGGDSTAMVCLVGDSCTGSRSDEYAPGLSEKSWLRGPPARGVSGAATSATAALLDALGRSAAPWCW